MRSTRRRDPAGAFFCRQELLLDSGDGSGSKRMNKGRVSAQEKQHWKGS
jgi:hypothetical protein